MGKDCQRFVSEQSSQTRGNGFRGRREAVDAGGWSGTKQLHRHAGCLETLHNEAAHDAVTRMAQLEFKSVGYTLTQFRTILTGCFGLTHPLQYGSDHCKMEDAEVKVRRWQVAVVAASRASSLAAEQSVSQSERPTWRWQATRPTVSSPVGCRLRGRQCLVQRDKTRDYTSTSSHHQHITPQSITITVYL